MPLIPRPKENISEQAPGESVDLILFLAASGFAFPACPSAAAGSNYGFEAARAAPGFSKVKTVPAAGAGMGCLMFFQLVALLAFWMLTFSW
ncbi:hypothetical protein IT084_12170 [Desulfallas sp. Bu1-1]|uniref:hypothetical protein n=1 Tax=Desulfallas sp. Bu1-1 TaxID=2787620 RepID=UPI00189D323A|nr:hypothetical protein [Desulfallas sp. Bu1-1]MBF7083728.1 hypothetical protein [Desulfallas sp. Bu1-1]